MAATNSVKPSEYVTSGEWRGGPHEWDIDLAHRARRALIRLRIYPPREMSGQSEEVHEANVRAIMAQIAEEMDFTDLVALHRITVPMFKVPREPALFEMIAARSQTLVANLHATTRTHAERLTDIEEARKYVVYLEGKLADEDAARAD
ncbi:MAG TPA: hypothetical protein VMV87_03430 [Burkholderiales bacterium]|nr:hypothetical protein [Burkholderiales bacterium]